jgi:hypothetical protein
MRDTSLRFCGVLMALLCGANRKEVGAAAAATEVLRQDAEKDAHIRYADAAAG